MLALLFAAALTHAQTLPTTSATAAPTTEPYRPTLLALGTPDHYWIAYAETYLDGVRSRIRTVIRGQELPAGDWQDLGAVYGRAVALAESQGDLAILLEDGSWKRRTPSGLATGPVIPGSGPVLAWASSPHDLYAIRSVEGGIEGVTTRPTAEAPRRSYDVAAATPPSSAPATRPSADPGPSIATRPTAAPASTPRPATRPSRPILLRFEQGQWVAAADLPPDVDATRAALAVVANKVLLATPTDGGTIRTFALTDGHWQPFGQIRPAARPGGFGLLAAAGGTLPALWTIHLDGQMLLYLKREGEDWTQATPFQLPPNLPENAQRTLASAAGELRLVVRKDGKIFERRYDTTGSPRSELVELPTPQQGFHPDAMFWAIRGFVIAGMVLVMLLTFYHRRASDEARDDE
jgi:hypothetical protein